MGDKGGKKNRDKDQKQKAIKHTKDLKKKKDKEPKGIQKQIQWTKNHSPTMGLIIAVWRDDSI